MTRLACVIALLSGTAALRLPPVDRAVGRSAALDRRSANGLIGLGCLAPCLSWPASAMAAEDQLKYFPGAMSSAQMDRAVHKSLSKRGYTKDNTLFGMSVCSDEVNYADKELISLMKDRWGEAFALGGLAGVPFAGKAGLGAYAHHVPDEGRLLIVFAPHVGVDQMGGVGGLERAGMSKVSGACGAGIGAYKTLSKPGAVAPANPNADSEDFQFEYIKYNLAPKLDGIGASEDKIAYVTYQMYQVVRDAMLANIKASPGIWDGTEEIAVLGGVQINRFNSALKKRDALDADLKAKLSGAELAKAQELLGGIDLYERADAFQPLMYQTMDKTGKMTDLYSSTFGAKPDLSLIVGSAGTNDELWKGQLMMA